MESLSAQARIKDVVTFLTTTRSDIKCFGSLASPIRNLCSCIKNTITREQFTKLYWVKPTTDKNPAADYLDKRKITNRDSFFYTTNYGALLKELDLSTYSHEFNCNEERLLIPHFNRAGNLAFIQMRVLNNSTIRYRTYKVIEEEYKLWNIDQVNLNKKIYVVEGQQ